MKSLNLVSTLLYIILQFSNVAIAQEEEIFLKDGWKFKPGDDLNYSISELDDSEWTDIKIDKIWEEQGYDPLDGYCWYRIKVLIPSSLKNKAYLQDSLKIFFGKINNYDQAFINGKIFGINNVNTSSDYEPDTSFINAPIIYWDMNRRYTLPADDPRILWDKENVIAVRVYDQGGQGGIYTGNAFISMTHLKDYLTVDYGKQFFSFTKEDVKKSIQLINTSNRYDIGGKFTILAVNKIEHSTLFEQTIPLLLKAGDLKDFNIEFPRQDQSSIVSYVFEFSYNKEKIIYKEETPYTLTPEPSLMPRINSAKIYGQRPGKPFLFKIAATGQEPLTFDAEHLPTGLEINKSNGIISGTITNTDSYNVTIIASNNLGEARSPLKIVIGDQIALTPPMGWNSWNCWGLSVDQEKVISSAKMFVEKGLIDHGWTYINIDDGWEIVGNSTDPKRDENGNILVNEKFPYMAKLGEEIHDMGLKFGIYSSPGPLTCGGYTASYQHELQDAQSFASWGIDYLKYDWCSYDNIAKDKSREELMKPYFVMRDALDKIDRDIVYSLCQYGMGNVWEWGAEVGGNLWRTTGDITDTWESMSEIGFNQIENAKYAQPGHWNDPDMLVVGWVGWGPSLHPTKLTPDEQYTHISLWSLLSAPLLLGCDLARLDEFTLNLLTNDEVLAIDQDPLGKQAIPVIKDKDIQVWVKELEDGNKAVGIFNLGDRTRKFTLVLNQIGFDEKIKIRDLWRQKDLGEYESSFESAVPSHGVMLLKLYK